MEASETKTSIIRRPQEWAVATRDFFRDVNAEMKKVSWPARPEVVGTTVVVIVATFVFALYLWACDLAFYKAIDFLFTRFGAST